MPLDFRPTTYIHADPRKPRPIAITGILRVGDLAIISGSWDTFKSTFALELVSSLATGEPFLGWFRVWRKIRMGIVQAEIDPGSYDGRVVQFPASDDLFVASDLRFSFDRLGEVEEAVRELDLGGVAFDPLGQMWPSRAENGEPFSENVKTHISPLLRRLKLLGVTVILVHHDPKPAPGVSRRASGSSALLNDPDTRIFLDRGSTKDDSHRVSVELRTRLQSPATGFDAVYQEGRLKAVVSGKPVVRRG